MEKLESVRLLTKLGLPLVRMRIEKIGPNNPEATNAKWRRVPCEKWKDVEFTERLAESFFDCNVAVKTGHELPNGKFLCILDVDLKKQEGRDWWSRICDQYGDAEFWAGPISRTESGGLHLWFCSKVAYHTAAPLLPGVDFLALGGLSFEPPSQFREGSLLRNAYEWITPPVSIDGIPDIPSWLRAEVEIRELKRKAIKDVVDANESQYGSSVPSGCLPFIEDCLARHTPENGLEYAAWLRLGMALHDSASGCDSAFDIFDAWGSRVARERGGDYDSKKTRVSWVSFGHKQTKVRYGTLVRTLAQDDNVRVFLDEKVKECANFFDSLPHPEELPKSHTKDPSVPSQGEYARSQDVCVTVGNPAGNPAESDAEVSEGGSVEKKKKKKDKAEKPAHKERGQTVEHLEMNDLLRAVHSSLGSPLIRTNETNGAIEITLEGKETRKLDQPTEDAIVLTCLDFGKRTGVKPLTKEKMVHKAINILADQNKYNPIREYLTNCLTVYKKQKIIDDVTMPYQDDLRYRKLLISGIGLEPGEDADWFERALLFWLHGAICKTFYGFQNPMLCLQGQQGSGKSTIAKSLVKKIGTSYYYAGAIDPSDKDHKIKLAQLFLWEPDELGGTTQTADINKLKSLLTLNRINERPPYGRHVVDMPVVCSFLGTVNDASFLKDDTGNRRFLVARYVPINHRKTIEWLRGVEFDPDLLWGEVYAEVLRTKDFAPILNDKDSTESVFRAEEVRQKSDLEIVLEDLLEYQVGTVNFGDEWKLYRKDLRIALDDAGIKIGKYTLQRASEIVASALGYRHNARLVQGMDDKGGRFIKRVRIRSSLTTPPTMPQK